MKILRFLVWFALLPACASLNCYVEIATSDSGNVNWYNKPTTISDYYTQLTDQGVDPSAQSVWYFEIKSCQQAGILLTANRDLSGVLMEIIIGSYGNTRYTVWKSSNDQQLYELGPILNCTVFTRFWLTWDLDGNVELGAGNTAGIDTHFTASKPGMIIGGIGINSNWDSNGVWRYGVSSNMNVPDSCPATQTTSPTTETLSTSNDCNQAPTILRTDSTHGIFIKETGIQLSALNQIGSSSQCTELQCARSCLLYHWCWYFRFDTSGSGCQPCLLYDSSVNVCLETGPGDGHLYKWG